LEVAAQRKKTAQHVRAGFAQIFQDTYQETMSIATSRSYADQWLATKKPETAAATLKSYSKTISGFMEYLGPKADRDLSEVCANPELAGQGRKKGGSRVPISFDGVESKGYRVRNCCAGISVPAISPRQARRPGREVIT